MNKRNLIFGLVTALILIVINSLTIQKELLAHNGQLVYLELAPVDPRSLLQGDYMRLRYAVADEASQYVTEHSGFIIVQLDEKHIAHYVHVDDGRMSLDTNELRLPYRQRRSNILIGADSYFFQEGHAQTYARAHYAELRVSPSGDVLLIGLRGADLEPLMMPGE